MVIDQVSTGQQACLRATRLYSEGAWLSTLALLVPSSSAQSFLNTRDLLTILSG